MKHDVHNVSGSLLQDVFRLDANYSLDSSESLLVNLLRVREDHWQQDKKSNSMAYYYLVVFATNI